MTFLPSYPPRATRLALLVDGENISADLAGLIITKSLGFGQLVIRRVYGNAGKMPKWDAAPGFRLIHSGAGKNATDLLLAVEAMSLLHDGRVDALVLVTSDGDFTHLAAHLRERGVAVYGMGEAKAAERFRKACSIFVELKPPSDTLPAPAAPILLTAAVASATKPAPSQEKAAAKQLYVAVVATLKQHGDDDGWLRIQQLGSLVRTSQGKALSGSGFSKWRTFLNAYPGQLELEPVSPDARVRLRKS